MGDVNTNIRMAGIERGRLRCKYQKRSERHTSSLGKTRTDTVYNLSLV